MGLRYGAVLAGAFVFGHGAIAQPSPSAPYVEVSGRLENLFDYESTNDPDDLLGHGWMTARLHDVRVIKGPPLPRTLTVRYFGHTFIKHGKRMRFKLRRGDDERYLVCVPAGSVGVQCTDPQTPAR